MTLEDFKAQAERLADHLSRVHGFSLKRAAALEALAALHGAANWNVLRAKAPAAGLADTSPSAQVPEHARVALRRQQPRWYQETLKRIDASLESGGPIEFPEDARMLKRQLKILVHDFPAMHEFWRLHALPSKVAPSCMCCGKSSYDVETAFRHPKLPNVFVCRKCISAGPGNDSPRELKAWVVDDGDWLVAYTLEEGLAWCDREHGPCQGHEGRMVVPIPLDEPVHIDESPTSAAIPFRRIVDRHIELGGKFPAVLAHELAVL